MIKLTVYAKMKITKFPLLSKPCTINDFWGFYLNYEGLKQDGRAISRTFRHRFYLNYEGLKPLKTLLKLLSFYSCFYLNYEGLKQERRHHLDNSVYVFILTMRD